TGTINQGYARLDLVKAIVPLLCTVQAPRREAALTIIPISHRGFWLAPEEKNSEAAFRRSLEKGFGTETDLRDRLGDVVIAHDMAGADNISFDRFLQLYREYPGDPVLALNIKSDGLQDVVGSYLRRY